MTSPIVRTVTQPTLRAARRINDGFRMSSPGEFGSGEASTNVADGAASIKVAAMTVPLSIFVGSRTNVTDEMYLAALWKVSVPV